MLVFWNVEPKLEDRRHALWRQFVPIAVLGLVDSAASKSANSIEVNLAVVLARASSYLR